LLIDLPATDLMLIRGGAEDLVRCDIGDRPCQEAAGVGASQTGIAAPQTVATASHKTYTQICIAIVLAGRYNVSVIEGSQVSLLSWLKGRIFQCFEVAYCRCRQVCHWPLTHLRIPQGQNVLVKYCKVILLLFNS
jgi:hypothetical protein